MADPFGADLDGQDEDDWPAIRLAYETTPERLETLCSRFGIARSDLRRRRRLENWRRRDSTISGLRDQRLAAGMSDPKRKDPTEPGPDQINEIRVLYEAEDVPIRVILERFGLTQWQLRKLRMSGQWPTRLRVADPTGKAPQTVATSANALAHRLLKSLRRQVNALEKRTMRDGYDPTPQDARLTEDLARSVKKIGQMVDQVPAGSASQRGRGVQNEEIEKREAEAADVEWIRDQLQNRLAVLVEHTGSDRGAEILTSRNGSHASPDDQLGDTGASRPEATEGGLDKLAGSGRPRVGKDTDRR